MPEKEYIEREALMTEINRIGGHNLCEWSTIGVKALVERQPTADVAEVKHGEWIKTDKGKKCSSCNCLSSLADANLKSVYCPWCGADMRGEKNGK